MDKFFYKIINFYLKHKAKSASNKHSLKANAVYVDSTTKTSMNSACTLKLTSQTEANKSKVNITAKEIVKKNIKTPDKLLDIVESKGTKVYKTKYALSILKLIGEEEGFLTPLKGFKAICLNLILGFIFEKRLNISFETKELFLLRDLPVDIYIMSHQFHKWYGFKMKLPGYDIDTQEKFKRIYKTFNDNEIKDFSLAEVISIKEAIARDVESIDFVLNLAKEYDGSKNALAKIKAQKGARV